MASVNPLLLKGKKVCRFTKWLLNTQTKLRTAINRSSITTIAAATTTTNNHNKSCSHDCSKAKQQRRVHNEIFGWTSDAWDEMSMNTTSTTTSLYSPAPTTPSIGCMSREEALRCADDYTIRRIEKASMHNTTRHPRGRRPYIRVEGY
ncbi:unnamed protein product [Aureobasidium uvarum]|uniref:Uncharacterized protein n=1 Tax=Aureobasidium uvarum TaxID=2773716 RepID=A0A9N8KU49_9PEZI|nr:unnamed protein product [Aureobasidium uvarum]